MESRERVLRKQQKIPSGHDPAAYVVRRLFAPTADNELVPITVLHRKGLKLDGSAPLFLEGYGAYAFVFADSFDSNLLSLVDRGFVYAIAHIRGGLEKGERWRRGGRRETKVNTFTDFIAVAEYLIKAGYTSRGRIVARGDSAGGLLMGAIANMRPDLFAGIVARVPVRRCPQHHARRDPAADRERPTGMGRPDPRSRRLPADRELRALRERQAPGLSAHAGHRRTERSAGELLGAGEMGRQAARDEDQRQPDRAWSRACRPAISAPPAGSNGSTRWR